MNDTTTRRLLAAGFALAALGFATGCGALDSLTGSDDAGRDSNDEITESGDQDVFTLKVGDCLGDSGSGNISSVEAIPCDDPHVDEIYHSFEMPDGDWPGDDAITAAAEDECGPAFDEFVGLAYDDSTLDWTTITPTQSGWEEADDHEVLCLIYDPNDDALTGSLEGAAR